MLLYNHVKDNAICVGDRSIPHTMFVSNLHVEESVSPVGANVVLPCYPGLRFALGSTQINISRPEGAYGRHTSGVGVMCLVLNFAL